MATVSSVAIALIISVAFAVMSSVRNAFETGNMTAANHAGHIPLAIPAPAFKLDIIKEDAETIRANLAHTSTVIKVNITIANTPCGAIDLCPASLNRVTAQLTLLGTCLAPLIQAIASMAAAVMTTIIVPHTNHQACIWPQAGFNPGRATPTRIGNRRGYGES